MAEMHRTVGQFCITELPQFRFQSIHLINQRRKTFKFALVLATEYLLYWVCHEKHAFFSQQKPHISVQTVGLGFDDHGDFVTFRKLDALEAIRPDFMGQSRLVHFVKADFLKKINLIGENKDAAQAQINGLLYAGLHKFSADALLPIGFSNHQRSDLRQVFPTDMHAACADNSRLLFDLVDKDVSEIVKQFTEGSRQQIPTFGVTGKHFLDFTDVADLGFSDSS
jgi:hypothetical protein